jgi:uncharacterized protein
MLLSLCTLCCALSLSAWAGRPVRVYEVDVDGQTPAAVRDAMRQALVRATGRREAADDPAFAPLLADAPKYVRSYATGPRGESQVVFDGAAVEAAIGAAGRSVWDHERPFTLIVLDPPRTRAAADSARAELERVATERGLPVSLIPLPLADASGTPLAVDALLQAVQRYGGDELLVGKGDPTAADAPLQWTLYTHVASETWGGTLANGIDHTVDFLVPRQATSLSQAESTLRIEVDDVTSLSDYATVQRLLESVPGVRHANIAAADARSVMFDVLVRGGAAALEQGLAATTHLVRGTGSGPRVVYRYQPGG